MKNKFIPFFNEDNGFNLPFVIEKDDLGNDVLVISIDKKIPLNKSNTDINYQTAVYNNCCEGNLYSANEIENCLYVIREKQYYKNYSETKVKIIDNEEFDFCTYVEDEFNKVYMSYNSKYIVFWNIDEKFPMNDVVAAYDIENKKSIDCTDQIIVNELIKSVVKYRRCAYDILVSILKEDVLVKDPDRLYSFMSFLTNRDINDSNYQFVVPVVKEYVIKKYPKLKTHKINVDNLKKLTKYYGLDSFVFKQIDRDIKDLTYKENKEEKKLVKKQL